MASAPFRPCLVLLILYSLLSVSGSGQEVCETRFVQACFAFVLLKSGFWEVFSFDYFRFLLLLLLTALEQTKDWVRVISDPDNDNGYGYYNGKDTKTALSGAQYRTGENLAKGEELRPGQSGVHASLH